MSYVIMIFCQSDAVLTREEIAREIKAGVFFDTTPTFDPAIGSEEAKAGQWKRFAIAYAPGKRPVVLYRGDPITEIQDDLDEDFRGGVQSGMRQQLLNARQIYRLDVDQSGLSDEAWEMCDFLERFIAQKLDCLIYAPGDAIYDAALRPLVKKSAKS